jgi:hypothetical protein
MPGATPGAPPPPKKSNVIWWVLGGVLVVGVIGIGLVVMILAIASMSTQSNVNRNANNSNDRVVERNSNNNANQSNSNNADSDSTGTSQLTDDFSTKTWGSGNFKYGDIWYDTGEYHMRSKENTFLVMYAPSPAYKTDNATVRVTVRSVDGTPTSSGHGLLVHGDQTGNLINDYALLIYTGDDPQYSVVMHKASAATTLVKWTKSSVIKTGTHPNELEIRVKGAELSFYINGQFVEQITDSGNLGGGLAGFYTSGTTDVAFDGLQIVR